MIFKYTLSPISLTFLLFFPQFLSPPCFKPTCLNSKFSTQDFTRLFVQEHWAVTNYTTRAIGEWCNFFITANSLTLIYYEFLPAKKPKRIHDTGRNWAIKVDLYKVMLTITNLCWRFKSAKIKPELEILDFLADMQR